MGAAQRLDHTAAAAVTAVPETGVSADAAGKTFAAIEFGAK